MPTLQGMDALLAGVDPKSKTLHEAAQKSDLYYFHQHLNSDDLQLVNQLNDAGQTPLMVAVIHGQLEAVKDLVDLHNADLRTQDPLGKTALHLAASHGLGEHGKRKKIAFFLMRHYARLDMIDAVTRAGMTPFHHAIVDGQITIALNLMSFGADKEAEDNAGITPLHYAKVKLKGEQEKLEKCKELQKERESSFAQLEEIEELKARQKITAQNIRKYTKLVECISTAIAQTQRLSRKPIYDKKNDEESPETAAVKRTQMLRILLQAQESATGSGSISVSSHEEESDAEEGSDSE